MSNEMNVIGTIIRERKSTWPKDFDPGRKIDNSIIKEILENAVWAPNHGLNQPWHFKVFHGEGIKSFFRKMKDIYSETIPIDNLNEKKLAKYDEKEILVSHVLAVCMQRDPKKRYPEIEDIVATACVVQNIYLQLKPYGISGYLSTGDICYTRQVKDFLELAEEDRCIGFFQLGYTLSENKNLQRSRISAVYKTVWIGE